MEDGSRLFRVGPDGGNGYLRECGPGHRNQIDIRGFRSFSGVRLIPGSLGVFFFVLRFRRIDIYRTLRAGRRELDAPGNQSAQAASQNSTFFTTASASTRAAAISFAASKYESAPLERGSYVFTVCP